MFFSLIDRNAQIRGDKNEIALKLGEQSRFIIYAGEGLYYAKLAYTKPNLFFTWQELKEIQEEFSEVIYLGQNRQYQYFAYHLDSPLSNNSNLSNQVNLQQITLKQSHKSDSEFESALLFYTQGLMKWHEKHQFCSKCGEKTLKSQSGHARQCINQKCKSQHFPKIEPAVIFSIVNNNQESKILMARQASWDKGRFSVIAGFVESGESLEDAVKREAYEETGLSLKEINYISSQPWPFPNSLMLGFSCVTSESQINLIDQELEQADWFSANQLEDKVKTGEMTLPFSLSISWQLIDRWFIQQKGYSIDRL